MSEIFEFTEDLFLKAAKYPIKTSQILGYLPLTLKKDPKTDNRSLHFNWSSIPCIATIGQIFFMISFTVLQMFCFNIQNLENSQFDGISLGIMALIVVVNSLTQRLVGLFTARKTVDLWKSYCQLWSKAFQTEILNSSTQKKLQRIGWLNSSLALTVFASSVAYLLLLLTVEYIFIQFHWLQNGFISNSVRLNSGSIYGTLFILVIYLVSTFFMYMHPLGILWVTFFPQVHCLGLEIIHEKVFSIINRKDFEVEIGNNYVNKHVFQNIEVDSILSGIKNFRKSKSAMVPVVSLEKSQISEIVEMYHATVEMVKQYNCHFSGKLLLETLYSMVIALLFTYFIIFWTIDGKYLGAAINYFPLVMAFAQIQHLGNVGNSLSRKNSKVLEALHRLQLSQRSANNEMHLKVTLNLRKAIL